MQGFSVNQLGWGENCARDCANSGYWMASYNGYCYCEFNPENDFSCDSFASYEGYTTYKMTVKENEDYIDNVPNDENYVVMQKIIDQFFWLDVP